ncbi:unnamed protein product [Dicrocoelium dendriticum]|nr:unnamed protein product [Dicrocoelium dendriticum]
MANRAKAFIRIRPSASHAYNNKIFSDIRIKSEWESMFTKIFDNVSQANVFKEAANDFVPAALNGINGTLLCYGQTGAGKTYTMSGVCQLYPDRGIIPRSLAQLFEEISKQPSQNILVRLSYVEIYNEQLLDLLGAGAKGQRAHLSITDGEDEVIVKGLTYPVVTSLEEAFKVLFEGELNRTVGPHALNRASSRAHTIFTIHLTVRSLSDSNGAVKTSRIHYVDLAGSERVRKTHSEGQLLKEANYINRSLTFLEQTVLALSDPTREHIPYRHSKLTHYLKHAIGGRCQTAFIFNIWDEERFVEETNSTIRFANRVLRIPCKPVENQKYDATATINRLQKENERLKRELLMYDTLNNRGRVNYGQLTEYEKEQVRTQVAKFLDGKLTDLEVVNLIQLQEIFNSFKGEHRKLRHQIVEIGKQAKSARKNPDGTSTAAAAGTPTGQGTGRTSGKRQVNTDNEPPPTPQVGELVPSSGSGITAPDEMTSLTYNANSTYLQVKQKERAQNVASSKSQTENVVLAQPVTTDVHPKSEEFPSKKEAFEEFKAEAGRELFKVFQENKTQLAETFKEAQLTATQVNQHKARLEELHRVLHQKKAEREAQGLLWTTEGDPIITEEEFEAIESIRELKEEYNELFEKWKSLKGVVHYCRHMVDLARSKLVQEFDAWYKGSFLEMDSSEMKMKDNLTSGMEKQEEMEDFQRVQDLLFERSPDGRAYEIAKEAVIHKHVFGPNGRPKNVKYGLPRGIPVE